MAIGWLSELLSFLPFLVESLCGVDCGASPVVLALLAAICYLGCENLFREFADFAAVEPYLKFSYHLELL